MFFVKQKTAYEMRISDWSSDVCSSDLEETVGNVDQQDAVGLQHAGIDADRFPGQQVERDRVRRKAVDDQYVATPRRLLRQFEPRIAEDDRLARRAMGEEGELGRIGRNRSAERLGGTGEVRTCRIR